MAGALPAILAAILTLLCCGVYAALSPLKAVYADDLGMTVSPAEQRVALTPGQTTAGSLLLANASDTATDTIHVYATPFYSSGDDYSTGDFAASNLYTQMSGWVEFSRSTYVLKPRQQVVLRFKVNTPYDAPPGGQYAAIMCELAPEQGGPGGFGAKTVRRVASLLYGQVAGEVSEGGAVVAQDIPWFVPEGALHTTYAVQNSGNIDFNVAGHLSATPVLVGAAFDSGAASTADNSAGTYDVLPQTTRTCSLDWAEPAWGLYTVTQSVLLLGHPASVSHLCLVCPIWLLVLVCLLLALLICLLVYLLVHHHHQQRGARPGGRTPRRGGDDPDGRAGKRQPVAGEPAAASAPGPTPIPGVKMEPAGADTAYTDYYVPEETRS
jgi:hypothetical protein